MFFGCLLWCFGDWGFFVWLIWGFGLFVWLFVCLGVFIYWVLGELFGFLGFVVVIVVLAWFLHLFGFLGFIAFHVPRRFRAILECGALL